MLAVESNALAAVLGRVKVSPPPHLAILSGVRLTAAGGRLSCLRTDLDSMIEARVPCSSDDLDVIVPADVLAGYAARVDGPLGVAVKDGRLIVEARRSHTALALFDVKDWPKYAHVDGEGISLDDAGAAAVRSVAYAAGTDRASRLVLTGVHFSGEWAEASDSYRLAQAPCSLPEMVVPAPAVASLDACVVHTDGARATFRTDEQARTVGLLDSQAYPKTMSSFYTAAPNRIGVDKAQLVDAIKTVAPALGVVDRWRLIELDATSDLLTVRALGNDKASGEAHVDCDADCALAMRFNEKWLLDLIDANRAEALDLEVRGPGKPVSILNDDGSRHLLMPVNSPR